MLCSPRSSFRASSKHSFRSPSSSEISTEGCTSFSADISASVPPSGSRSCARGRPAEVAHSTGRESRQSTQQLQEGHHVGLILFREYEPPCTRTCEKEEGVVFRDIFECLRRVVVEVRSGVFDAPERWDFEQVREERPRGRRYSGRRARRRIVQHRSRVGRGDTDNSSIWIRDDERIERVADQISLV